jgi:hypothetical protein
MSIPGEGDQSTTIQRGRLPFALSEEQWSSTRNAGVWTKTAITTFRKLFEGRRDKAVNEELQNLYEILLLSVESEFEIAGQAVGDLQAELSLNRILHPRFPPVLQQNERSGRRASVDEHTEKRPCAVQLTLGGRGSPLGKVEVCVEGRAVGGGGGLRITGAGCQWELGYGVAKIFHKRFSRCV